MQPLTYGTDDNYYISFWVLLKMYVFWIFKILLILMNEEELKDR